jgi:hypothetical protein
VRRFWIYFMVMAAVSRPVWGQRVEVETPDRGKINHVQTALNHLTVLEMSEPVSAVAVGSSIFKVEWRENKVFIEPTEPDMATNLFVWTASGRFNYELDAAGAVPEMVFAVDQPVADPPPKINASADHTGDSEDPSPADVLIAAKPVRSVGSISEKNRVAVYITDLLEHNGLLLIRYSIRNGTKKAYVPGSPQVVALKTPQYHESLYTLKSSQLGSNETPRLKSSGEIVMDATKSEILSSRVEPGEQTTGVVAIKHLPKDAEPAVIRLVFLANSEGLVSATLVL